MSALPSDPPSGPRAWRAPSEEDWAELISLARRRRAVTDAYGLLDLDRSTDPEPIEGADLLARIEEQHTGELNDAGWLDRLEALARIEARVAALKAAAIAGFDDTTRGVSADLGHETPEPGDRTAEPGERRWHAGLLRSVSDEVGLVLGLHRGAADTRIIRSWELTHSYPRIHAALSDGTLTERAAFTLVDELSTMTDEHQVRAAETALLDWARKHPLQRIKQAARREIARHDAAAVDRIRDRSLADRAIRMTTDTCGVAALVSTHDAVDAAAAMTSLTQAAVQLRRAGDTRTLDQLRADIALHRMLGQPDPTGLPPVHTEVVIHGTAAELEAILQGCPGTGGDLEGHGPLPQAVLTNALANALSAALASTPVTSEHTSEHTSDIPTENEAGSGAADVQSRPDRRPADIQWRLGDRVPASNPLRYSPSAALDRWIRLRDRRCRFPGCNQIAARCDLDHRQPFNPTDPDGGRTTADNLHALCRHHHRLKHRGGWRLHRNPDGSTTWISPTGRHYNDDHTTDP